MRSGKVLAVAALATAIVAAATQATVGDTAATAATGADISVALAMPASTYAGDMFASTVTVTNHGPEMVTRTDLNVAIGGADYVSFAPAGAHCSFRLGLLSCYFDGLTAGQSASVTVTLVSSGTGTATLDASTSLQGVTDPDPSNNRASGSTAVTANPVAQQADLGLSMTGPSTLKEGQAGTWSITVTNASTTTSAGSVHILLTASGIDPDAVGSSGCSGGNSRDCNLGALAPGRSVTIGIPGVAVTVGQASTTATVTSDTADPDTGNNSATVATTVVAGADLAIEMSAPEQVLGGEQFVYRITVRNVGAAGSAGAVVDDSLSTAFGPNSAVATPSTGSCTVTQLPGIGGFTYYDHVHCELGPMPAGATRTVTIAEHGVVGPLDNEARVTSVDGDGNGSNDRASASVLFAPADVSVTLAGPATADHDTDFDYTVTVADAGPDRVALTFLSVEIGSARLVSSSVPCDVVSGIVECELRDLTAGESRRIGLTLSASTTGTIAFRARAGLSGAYETDDANNTATASTRVTGPGADFGVSISGPATVQQGTTFVLGVTLVNHGPETDNGGITATLPAGLAFVSADDMRCFGGAPGFYCVVSALTGGASKAYAITVRAAAAGTQTTTVRTDRGALVDPVSANDTASSTTVVTPPPPAIHCPGGVEASTDPGLATATVSPGTATGEAGTPPYAISGARSDGAALTASYPFGTTTITWTLTDANGLTASCAQSVAVRDDEPPTTVATPPQTDGWSSGPVVVHLAATDNVRVSSIAYRVGDAAEAVVPGATTDVTVAAEGVTTIEVRALDSSGNAEPAHAYVVRIDEHAPTLACESADGAWHAEDVSLACTASDGGSGLASPDDAAFRLSTNVAAGAESANARTGSREVCDAAGNCATAGPVGGNRVDHKAPAIAISAPSAGEAYTLGSTALAAYACDDGGAGVATCSGTVADGTALDLATPGTKQFEVRAADAVGNVSTVSVSYTVGYALCAVSTRPATPTAGTAVRVALTLCDATGRDLSSPDVAVTALSLDGAPLPASPAARDGAFRLAGDVYAIELQLPRALAPGTHRLRLDVTGDPTAHVIALATR
jgi:hypothetical protein